MNDNPKHILQPDVMLEMCKDPVGKEIVKDAIIKAKVAMAATGVMEYVNEVGAFSRILSVREQQDVCSIIYHCIHAAKYKEVIEYIANIPDECCAIGLADDSMMGNA